jgi:2',3'-cyclic-nucleotide 2'-phosphodiesterase (5'-nucleotidase family)
MIKLDIRKEKKNDAGQERLDNELKEISIKAATHKRVIQIQVFKNVIVAIGVNGARCWSHEYRYLSGGKDSSNSLNYPTVNYSVINPKPVIKFTYTQFRDLDEIMRRVNKFAENRKFPKARYTQIPTSCFWEAGNVNDNGNKSCYWAVGPASLFKIGIFLT